MTDGDASAGRVFETDSVSYRILGELRFNASRHTAAKTIKQADNKAVTLHIPPKRRKTTSKKSTTLETIMTNEYSFTIDLMYNNS